MLRGAGDSLLINDRVAYIFVFCAYRLDVLLARAKSSVLAARFDAVVGGTTRGTTTFACFTRAS